MGRHDDWVTRLRAAVLGGASAVLPEAERRAAFEGPPGPGARGAFLTKLRAHAWKLTDADLAALRAEGHSDDAIFDVTVAGAVGQGLRRLDIGLAALAAAQARTPARTPTPRQP